MFIRVYKSCLVMDVMEPVVMYCSVKEASEVFPKLLKQSGRDWAKYFENKNMVR